MAIVNATVRLGIDPAATADVPTSALHKIGTYDLAGHPLDLQGKPGQPRFKGHGAPSTVVGATAGDVYLDIDSGQLYELT